MANSKYARWDNGENGTSWWTLVRARSLVSPPTFLYTVPAPNPILVPLLSPLP